MCKGTNIIEPTMNFPCTTTTTIHTPELHDEDRHTPSPTNHDADEKNGTRTGKHGVRFPVRFHHFISAVGNQNPDVVRWVGEQGVYISEDHPHLSHYLEEYFNNGSLNSLKAKLYAYGWKKRCGRSKKADSADRIWLHEGFFPDPNKCSFGEIKCRQRSGNRFLHQQEGAAAHNGIIDETDNDCGMAFPTQKRGFPTLLHKFVNDTSATHPDVVKWDDRGDSFYVQLDNPKLNEILKPYFKHGNYLSLRRQLYAYGFTKKRRRRDHGVHWAHPSFQRDGIAGCGTIARGPNW